MRGKVVRIIVTMLCLGLLMATVVRASADAFVSSWSATCSSLRATGTTDAPYVTLYAYNLSDNVEYSAVYPVTGGSFDFTLPYTEAAEGSQFEFQVWGSLATYKDFTDPLYWDNGAFFNIYGVPCSNGNAGPDAPAPNVPAGFVMATITGNTPVYNLPGGTPVGSDGVTAGQTWYVNPVPVIADDGSSWTEIYVAGFQNPFIPTAFVG